MATSGEVYNVHYSDGTVETMVAVAGDLKQVGDIVNLENGRWVVTDLRIPIGDGEHVFDLFVVSGGDS